MILNMMSTPIKGEGMVANPDEFEFACTCKKCQDKYRSWKAKYQEQQREMHERMEVSRNLQLRQQED
jgi:hypothetical protein